MELNCKINEDIDYINEYSFNKLSIDDIKDYNSLDIEIINSLLCIKYNKNMVDIMLDYIDYENLSKDQFTKLLFNISYNNINNIAKYVQL